MKASEIKRGTKLQHIRQGFIVEFRNEIKDGRFWTTNDFMFNISEFKLVESK